MPKLSPMGHSPASALEFLQEGAWSKPEFCFRVAEACGRMARRSLVIFILSTVTESPQQWSHLPGAGGPGGKML